MHAHGAEIQTAECDAHNAAMQRTELCIDQTSARNLIDGLTERGEDGVATSGVFGIIDRVPGPAIDDLTVLVNRHRTGIQTAPRRSPC